MNPAPSALIDKLLMTRGASETYTLLQSFGYTTPRASLEKRVSEMIRLGIRESISSGAATGNDGSTKYGVVDGVEGCKAHHDALMRYYANREKGVAA